jgi:glycosyltransferase involved in cell wall biosynthesis
MLVTQLRQRGHRVEIISLPRRNYAGSFTDNFSNPLIKKLKKSKVDLLLQDELNHPSLFLLNTNLKKEVSYPIISIVHMVRNNLPAGPLASAFIRWVEIRYMNSVDGFVFNSQHTKKSVESVLTKKKPSVVATPGGDRFHHKITSTNIRARARRPGSLNVVFLGNLTRNKSAHVLIEAAAKLPRGSIDVLLAGREDVEPGYVNRLRRQIVRSGLNGMVRFAGHLQAGRLVSALRTSQLIVVPSTYEGFGIAYLEGMSFGLPAIATRSSGAEEIIQHGKNGYLISVGDAEQLARQLKRLHTDRSLLTRMSLAAHRTFNMFPTWNESMERVHNFLNSYNQSSPRTTSPRRKK